MKGSLSVVLLASFTLAVRAQQHYGNEWIDHDQRYWAFWVGTYPDGSAFEGIWRIDSVTLADAGFPIGSTDARAIQVFGRERQVAIWFPGDSDGVFNAADHIEFYVPPNDAWLDSALWDDPAHINNPYLSSIGDSIQYFVTIGDPQQSLRAIDQDPGDWAALPNAEPWYWADVFELPWPGQFTYKRGRRDYWGSTTSWMGDGEGFSFFDMVNDGDDDPNIVNLITPFPWSDPSAPPMKLELAVMGANAAGNLQYIDHKLMVTAGVAPNQASVDSSWIAEKTIKLGLEIPAGGYVSPITPVELNIVHDLHQTVSPQLDQYYPDRQALAYVKATYPHAIGAGTFPAQFYRMHFDNDGQDIRLDFTMPGEPVVWVFGDQVRRVNVEDANGGWNCRLPFTQGSATTDAVLTVKAAARPVTGFYPVNGTGYFTDHLAVSADSALIIVTHPALMNGTLQYAQYRETNTHNRFSTVVANVLELYQQYGGGILRHPVAIRRFVKQLADNATYGPQGLFLVGKATQAAKLANGDLSGYRSISPQDSVVRKMCLVPSFGYPPSDALFTMGLDGDHREQVIPVGRLAARNDQQVLDYLAKVQQLEAQQSVPAAWMKNILHFRGGFTTEELVLFQSTLDQYRTIAEDTCFTGKVTQFVKNPDDLISQAAADSVSDLIQQGVTLMTFFAHASGGGFDISIDQPNNYQWNGRYPFMIGNSCYTGNIHLPSCGSGSEQFVMPAGAGAIAFIASIDLALAQYLSLITREFYASFAHANYGGTIGRHIQYADSVFLHNVPPDDDITHLTYWTTAQQFTLQGDPVLRMNSPLVPELAITANDVRLLPDPVTADVDSFVVEATVRNLANACRCPRFPVAVKRQFGQGQQYTLVDSLVLDSFERTLPFTLPVLADSGGAGVNNLTVEVDLQELPVGLVDEYEDVANNSVTRQFIVVSGDIIPADPYNFAITPDPAPMLRASTGDPFAPVRNYVFQIDTTDTYDSPMMEHTTVSAPGGVVSWQPQGIYSLNQGQDSLVFYWRCAVDSVGNNGYEWKEFSFQHITGRTGWGQAHHFQFKDTLANNSFSNMVFDRPGRDFDFFTGLRSVGAVTQGNSSAICKWTRDLYTQERNVGCAGGTPSIMMAVIDPFDFTAWTSLFNGTGHHLGAYNSAVCNNVGHPFKAFFYRQNNPGEMAALAATLTSPDSIPAGHYLLFYTLRYIDLPAITGSGLMTAFAAMGADTLNSGLVPDHAPYIFFTRKGDPAFGQEVWSDDPNAIINIAVFLDANGNSGTMATPRSAEMLDWNSLHWRIVPEQEPSDSARIVIRAVDNTQQYEGPFYTVDPAATTDSLYFTDIGLNGSQYPRVRLVGAYVSEQDGDARPAQTKRWQIIGSPAPECAIDPPLGFFSHIDSLFVGQQAEVMVAVHNISDVAMDSLLMAAWLTDGNNTRHTVHWRMRAPLPVGGVLLDTIRFELQAGWGGMNALVIEANPIDTATGLYDQREQYHFNNIAILRFETFADRENPVLDVTFDGIHILDGDIVSAQPEVVMTLNDENTTLLFDEVADTAYIKVYLLPPGSSNETLIPFTDPGGAEVMRFTPTNGPENECRIQWMPDRLSDGVYRLRVRASDISGNQSGSHDLTVRFEVVNKPTITEVLNYPNPFTTSTRFVFTLTGSETPTGMRIRIMTISGRVVREIMLDELGPLHIGRNITDYAWDGTDQFGDKLARGVYLYQVAAQLHGEDIEHRASGADGYFKKGFGKMYLLR